MIPIASLCVIHDDQQAGVVAYRYHGEPTFALSYETDEPMSGLRSQHSALVAMATSMCRKEAAAIRGVLGCFPQDLWAGINHAAVSCGKCLPHLMFHGLNGSGFSAGVLCGVEELVAQRRVNKSSYAYLSENKYAAELLRSALFDCAVMALSSAKGEAQYCVNAALGDVIADNDELEFRKSVKCATAVLDSFVILACGYMAVMS